MKNDNLPGLSPLWLISLAMVLGTLIVVFLPFSITAGEQAKASDWIAFAGNLLAGVMTLIAAVAAWYAVQRQIRSQEQSAERARQNSLHDRERLQAEAKEAAAIILHSAVYASASVLNIANQISEIANAPEPDVERESKLNERLDRFDRVMSALDAVLSHFAVAQVWRELSARDRVNYLAVTATLHSAVAIHRHKISGLDKVRSVKIVQTQLTNLPGHWRAFDGQLGNSFDAALEEFSHGPTR